MEIELYERAEYILGLLTPIEFEDMEMKCGLYKELALFGRMIMKNNIDDSMIEFWKKWIERISIGFRREETELINKFIELYGFAPDDLVAKTKYTDTCSLEEFERVPENDIERDEFNEGIVMEDMMKMGWKPKW